MHTRKNGYVGGAYLFHSAIRKMRAHLELEKFICRVLKDDERTRQFKKKTDSHKNPIHALRYNSPAAESMTAAAKKVKGNPPRGKPRGF